MRLRTPTTLALLFLAAAVPAALLLAYWWRAPELINRAGATLSALGAALVIYQSLVEARIQQRERSEHERIRNLAPVNQETALRILANRGVARRHERLQIVTAIAIIVFVGEMLHGWGEFLYFGPPPGQ